MYSFRTKFKKMQSFIFLFSLGHLDAFIHLSHIMHRGKTVYRKSQNMK